VGVAGPGAAALVAKRFRPRSGPPLESRPDAAIIFGRFAHQTDDAAVPEDLVVVRHTADSLEIHCHGGLAAPAGVIASLEQAGAIRQPWREWLLAGGEPMIAVEAREALAACGGPKGAAILARQLGGILAEESARIAGLAAAGHPDESRQAIDRLLRASRVGLRLTEPWRVVVAGRVNAGKSSLVNAIAGHARSLVSPEPGTTRDLLETRLVLAGWEMDLIDTAGTRDGPTTAAAAPVTAIEREGIARAEAARGAADLVLHVMDATAAVPPPAVASVPVLHVVTKVDLLGTRGAPFPADWLLTSAVTGRGIDDLIAAIVSRLVPEEQDEPSLLAGPVPFTPRQVAELHRLLPPGLSNTE
jgi:tRNA modification GTPase